MDPFSDARLDDDLRASLHDVRKTLERRRELAPAGHVERLGRYALHDHLGAGATGTVYAATDLDRGLPVALKLLHRFDAERLASFKSEFRVASQCAHPALVSLFELVEHRGEWAIAMELVDGPSLLDFLRPAEGPDHPRALSVPRLRAALAQVVDGLSELHAAGILHRDLKPSNILVGRDGRVRIADFGLATLLEDGSTSSSREGMIIGTPAYMAPEMTGDSTVTSAADLYSLGVVLYEVLTGKLPFSGSILGVLACKLLDDPPDPAALAPDAPADLLALTRALLARDPAERPTLEEIAAIVSTDPAPSRSRIRRSAFRREIVGRSSELEAVRDAYRRASSGRPVIQRIAGASGMGKSTLLREIVRVLGRDDGALVLAGRCHELESIPHKGFDAIIDELRRAISVLTPKSKNLRLPKNAADAVPMFPVLADVVQGSRGTAQETSADERMRRAREAVVALLRYCHEKRPVVLALDDAQWGDAEGGALLESILTAEPACVAMVVLAYRDSEAASSALLRHLVRLAAVDRHYDDRTLPLAPLDTSRARELVRTLVDCDDEVARVIVEDARGEPFLLEQLSLAHLDGASEPMNVESVVLRRVRSFGDDGRRLVECAALAGAPLPERLLTDVADVRDSRPLLNLLVANSLLRRSGSGPTALVYPYHDKIRTVVADTIEPAHRRAVHLAIAERGAAQGTLPSSVLTRHFEDAGDLERATNHAVLAAAAAERGLAFEAAAAMHARVIALSRDEKTRQEARSARARALFVAGRCDEAGAAFEEAAEHADPAEALSLQRDAVYAYFSFGCIAEGLEILRPLVTEAGMPYPTTPRELMWSVGREIAGVRVRTLWRPSGREVIDANLASRSDLAWNAGIGLTNVAPAQGVGLTLASLRFAIGSGCKHRIARGLAFAGCGFAPGLVGTGERYLMWAEQFANELDDDEIRILHAASSGTRGFVLGDWERCVRASQEALDRAERSPHPTSWHRAIARTFIVSAYEYMGEYRKMESSCRDFLRQTRGRGDRITEVMIVSALGYPLAARHDAAGLDGCIEEMHLLMADWTVPYPFWEAFRLRLRCLRALCFDDVPGALASIEAEWPRLQEHRMLDLPVVLHPLSCVRTSILLEAARLELVDRSVAFAHARASARSLAGAPRAEGPTAARVVRASMAHLDGRNRVRDEELERAATFAREGKMRAVELMIERARALLASDAERQAAVETELHQLGVTDPDSWARFVTPVLRP